MGKLESLPISPGSQSHVPNFGSGGTEPDRFFAGDQFEFTNGPGPLMAGHLQGPRKFTTQLDHLLSLVPQC